MEDEIVETEYDVFYFPQDIKETLAVQEKDVFFDLLETKRNMQKEFDIMTGGAKNLNKILIEDWAPKDENEFK
jgi:hypothetical protein